LTKDSDGKEYCAGYTGTDTYIYEQSTRSLPTAKGYVRYYYAPPITALYGEAQMISSSRLVGSTATPATPGSTGSEHVRETGTPSAAHQTSISNGSKVGIGVGVSVSVCILIFAIFLFVRRRRVEDVQSLETTADPWAKPDYTAPKSTNTKTQESSIAKLFMNWTLRTYVLRLMLILE
jgi:hypothetical protein